MKIHIIGAGSLGLLYGGRLAAAGCEVTFWCRSREQAEQLAVNGLHIESKDQPVFVPASSFQAKPADLLKIGGQFQENDFIFWMVKQSGFEAAASELLVPYASEKLKLVCFQNGTGHMEVLERLLPLWDLYSAVTTEGAVRTESARVFHAGKGTTWVGRRGAGEMSGQGSASQQPDRRQDAWNSLRANQEKALLLSLQRAGFEAFLSNDLEHMVYRKLLMNAVINPLTAIWRIRNGELLLSPERMDMMRELFEEAANVYRAAGLPVDDQTWEQILQVCRSTGSNMSSMLKDVMEGRRTEVSAINGSIVRMGEAAGVETPMHRLIWKIVEGIHIKEA